ncbi:MAG: SPFH domain-containing protein [Caldilineaceae bacterium]|nr:SPFH domain-containing protein [Caldilineaceae bacterium]
MWVSSGVLLGFIAWFVLRYILTSFYTVDQNERAVKTSFGRAQRVGKATTLDTPLAETLRPHELERYAWPQVRVIGPGGPYFKWPWETIHKVKVATETINMAKDLEDPSANSNGTMLEAVTKDQLNTGLEGQIRYRASEANLYAYLFGVKQPIVHTMGYFVAILRERIANFEAPQTNPIIAPDSTDAVSEEVLVEELNAMGGISINDIRKNLSLLNDLMEQDCRSSEARYGVVLDASLITAIDPPEEVESALAAINTAHNQVSSDISLAQAAADQKIVQSKRAVEIETLKAHAEVEPLRAMFEQLTALKDGGAAVLQAYLRNIRMQLYAQAQHVILEERNHD